LPLPPKGGVPAKTVFPLGWRLRKTPEAQSETERRIHAAAGFDGEKNPEFGIFRCRCRLKAAFRQKRSFRGDGS